MISSMNISAVKQICSWKYPAPYDVYNYMSFEEAVKTNSPLLNAENKDNYLCFWENDILTAYINIYRKDSKIFLGIGIMPDYCGKGLGKAYLEKGISVAKSRYPKSEIWVEVRSWNKRAVKCYEKCGFKEQYRKIIKDRFKNNTGFVFMKR